MPGTGSALPPGLPGHGHVRGTRGRPLGPVGQRGGPRMPLQTVRLLLQGDPVGRGPPAPGIGLA